MSTSTTNLGLTKPDVTELYDIEVFNGNADKIDVFAGSLATVATSGAYSDLSGKPTIPTVDAALDSESANAIQNAAVAAGLAARIPLGIGTAITDPAPSATPPVYADLFELPVGVYWRQTNITNTLHLPSGVTGAFYCVVVNTISASRRKIYLFPCSGTKVGEFYTCTEMSSGYGSWYKFAGEAVT